MGTQEQAGMRPLTNGAAAAVLSLALVGAGMAYRPAHAADAPAKEATPAAKATAEPARKAAPTKKAAPTQPAKAAKKAVKAAPPAAAAPPEDAGGVMTTVTVLDATLGKSVLVNLERPIARLSVGNPAVADVILIGSKQLYVLGKTVGSTNLMLWDRQGRTAAVIDLNVSRELGALSSEMQKLVPGGSLRARSMGASILLEGHVPDALTASRASELAEAFLGKKPVNMLIVDGVQQVMLEVKVAEINRTLLDSLGAKFSLSHPLSGGIGWTILGDLLSTSGSPNFTVNMPGGTTRQVSIDMLKTDGLVKILAEPNIVAMSGQEGGFLSGGQIFIPVPGGGGFGVTTLQSQTFGVGLKFTPTVLDGGRIHMHVAPEVTDVVGFTNTNIAGGSGGGTILIPTLSTRRADTTVELRDGQTLAIGGLLNDRTRESINRLPILGEIPILGALFRSSEFQTDRTELVILVTPRLIKPLAGTPRLPTDGFKEPTRGEFFLGGKMEGAPDSKPAPAAPADGGHQLK